MNMIARVGKPRTRSSRLNLSNAAFEKVGAVVRDGTGTSSPSRQQSAKTPVYTHSQVDPTLEIIPSPENRAKRPYTSFLADAVDQQPASSPAPKRYRPESVDRFVTQWVESGSGSESYRERHCRSDSLLNHSDGDLISRRLTKSAPSMCNEGDAERFKKPTTPASATSQSYVQSVRPSDAASSAARTDQSSKKSLVEDQNYRSYNLTLNNIYMRSSWEQFPEHISSLVDQVGRDRGSPGPSAEDVRRDGDLEDLGRGAAEIEVQSYFQTRIFPYSEGALKCSDRMPMAKHAVPKSGTVYKVSNPVPDLLYGYDRDRAYPQHAQLGPTGNEMPANIRDLVYPFFVIGFKGDGPSGAGSLWVATNQCLGGSASCVNLAERLNNQLRQCGSLEIQPINSATFSVAMNGTEARLYISWKHDELQYYLQDIRTFALREADQYLQFRKYVRNIIDWGKHRRLAEIRDLLDKVLEESRRASEAAKHRPPPSDGESASSSSRKRKAGMATKPHSTPSDEDSASNNSSHKRKAGMAAGFRPTPPDDGSASSSTRERNVGAAGTRTSK